MESSFDSQLSLVARLPTAPPHTDLFRPAVEHPSLPQHESAPGAGTFNQQAERATIMLASSRAQDAQRGGILAPQLTCGHHATTGLRAPAPFSTPFHGQITAEVRVKKKVAPATLWVLWFFEGGDTLRAEPAPARRQLMRLLAVHHRALPLRVRALPPAPLPRAHPGSRVAASFRGFRGRAGTRRRARGHRGPDVPRRVSDLRAGAPATTRREPALRTNPSTPPHRTARATS
ncbi:hypothetical protein C8R44DRAFT_736212 [Mycena epipterygia]|nr:hypothetical protein C8R44DRAFT_736212 [Mycena epipterygia]